MKDCDSRRSWIGGEGLPSKDQVKEKREQRKSQVGFHRAKPQERVESYGVCHTILEVVYVDFNGYRRVYVGLLKKRHIHLEKYVKSRLYNRADFARFVSSCISLSGPLSLLREP
jgi:hypothetical protein